MRPGFRPIFPGMRSSVRADKMLVPIGPCTLRIISFEGRSIILPLIAEQLPESLNYFIIARDQGIPVIMTDFMPEMSQQSPVPLSQVELVTHPLRFIRLLDIDRDDALIMP